jgi:phosphoribosylanthranilate isomerase
MRNPQNIKQVSKLKINCMGFIFYQGSPRYVFGGKEPWEGTCPAPLYSVGVFVDAKKESIMQAVFDCGLDIIQLHGQASPALCRTLREDGLFVIRAIAVEAEADLEETKRYEGCVDYFLFDTKSAVHGGSGQSFDWSVLNVYQGETPFLLSGGIRPESLEAIQQIRHPRFAGIDLNSGFEQEPGIKDVKKLSAFVSALRTSTNMIQDESNNLFV